MTVSVRGKAFPRSWWEQQEQNRQEEYKNIQLEDRAWEEKNKLAEWLNTFHTHEDKLDYMFNYYSPSLIENLSIGLNKDSGKLENLFIMLFETLGELEQIKAELYKELEV